MTEAYTPEPWPPREERVPLAQIYAHYLAENEARLTTDARIGALTLRPYYTRLADRTIGSLLIAAGDDCRAELTYDIDEGGLEGDTAIHVGLEFTGNAPSPDMLHDEDTELGRLKADALLVGSDITFQRDHERDVSRFELVISFCYSTRSD